MKKRTNIVLIGMPGVGKSVLGKELAERLGLGFVDVDNVIEGKAKLSLQQIIDRFGDERFVEIEEEAIMSLGECANCVISPGGSAVYSEKAMDFLSGNAVVIFLKTSLETIRKNITNQDARGIVGLKGKNLEALFEERAALYTRYADITIEVASDYDIDLILEEILQNLSEVSG